MWALDARLMTIRYESLQVQNNINSSLNDGQVRFSNFQGKGNRDEVSFSKTIISGIGLENISNILLEILRSFLICLVPLWKSWQNYACDGGLVKSWQRYILCDNQEQFLTQLLHLSITLLLLIKCSAAQPSFGLCCLNCAQQFDLITAHSAVVGFGSW